MENREPVILYFGNDWAAENRTSSHHIAERLARRFRVYYFECPGLRAPRRSARDIRKVFRKLWSFVCGGHTVSDRLRVDTLLQVPFHGWPLVGRLNRFLTLAVLRWKMLREGIRRPVVWMTIPHPSHLLGRLGEQASVYYCTDDYASHPGVDPDAVRRMDDRATRQADTVFVVSQTLFGSKQALNPRTFLSPHGVDTDHFARARDRRTSTPAEVARLPRPVVGFFGLIEKWIDLELVDWLAAQRPDWNFLFIGRVAVPAERLPGRPNLHWIGPRPYAELPAYGTVFDAAIIPYRTTEQSIYHSSSLKLREYLAMGVPVVTVSTPEIDKFSDVVSIARSRDQFLAHLDSAIAAGHSAEQVGRRMARIASSSWDARAERLLELVLGQATEPPVAVPSVGRSPVPAVGV